MTQIMFPNKKNIYKLQIKDRQTNKNFGKKPQIKLTMRRSFLYRFLLMMCLTLLRVAREFLLMVIFS